MVKRNDLVQDFRRRVAERRARTFQKFPNFFQQTSISTPYTTTTNERLKDAIVLANRQFHLGSAFDVATHCSNVYNAAQENILSNVLTRREWPSSDFLEKEEITDRRRQSESVDTLP